MLRLLVVGVMTAVTVMMMTIEAGLIRYQGWD
jgi:hypothetical protein